MSSEWLHDIAVVNSRRHCAQRGALLADVAVKHVDIEELRAERDQATQNAAAAVAAADYGQAVEVAALYARRCLTATRNPSSSPG